jgi:hypothetical protein
MLDVPTCLTTVYSIVDDLYQQQYAAQKPTKPGHREEVSDSEVLSLMVLAQWHPHGERAFLRYVARHWRADFPRQLSQSAFNRRGRALAPLLCHLGPLIAREVARTLAGPVAYAVLDGVPVPLRRRCRGEHHACFTEDAAVGRGGSDRDWYYGVKLLAVVDQTGLISGFVFGPAATGEHWLAEALLRWRVAPASPPPTAAQLAPILGPSHQAGGGRVGPTGPLQPRLGAGEPLDASVPYLSDLGLRGPRWQEHWHTAYGATVLTPADFAAISDPDERAAWQHRFHSLRQVVETTKGLLSEVFHLARSRARTVAGLWARLGAKVAAANLLMHLNHMYTTTTFGHFNPIT